MPECVVVNIHHSEYEVYIGRPGKGQPGRFGNPHPIGWCQICKCEHRRGEAVSVFNRWFLSDHLAAIGYRKNVDDYIKPGDRLGCFCKQSLVEVACHGDIIAKYVNLGYDIEELRKVCRQHG